MKRRKAKVEKNNTKIAVFFVIFVCLIILASFILKVVQTIGQSKFDGSSRFTISVSNNKKLQILSFSPYGNTISVISVSGEVRNLNINKFLAIPIDGFVQGDFLDMSKDVQDLISSTLLGFRNVKSDLNIVDILRLFLFSKTVPSKNIAISEISTSLEEVSIDKIIGQLLYDKKIEKEYLSIEIINATTVTGLGARMARFIENMGGKVVQVSSENVFQKTSLILYNGDKTYTLEKLHRVLGFKLSQANRQSIGDITIIIGEDSKHLKLF